MATPGRDNASMVTEHSPEVAKRWRGLAKNRLTPHRRIEECIHRYRSCRRIDSERANFLNKWLFLGGISGNPHQLPSGVGDQFYCPGSTHWSVDFAGVVAGFLSEAVPRITGRDNQAMGRAVALVENFLLYVLHHDVCPEFAGQVRAALAVCKRAQVELPLTYECLLQFPGQFGLAAMELYCEKGGDFWPAPNGFVRPADFQPGRVFQAAISLQGSPEQIGQLQNGDKIFSVAESFCHMEVVSVHRPSLQISKVFESIQSGKDKPFRHAAIGKAVLKPCMIQDGWDYRDLWNSPAVPKTEVTFLLDDAILVRMKPGFKLAVVVVELNIGVKFIKEVRSLVTSFYEFLPQELMKNYKEPRPNDRPPPTAGDPDAEERDMGKQVNREL
jgi:hypothetical protein